MFVNYTLQGSEPGGPMRVNSVQGRPL